jgi:hypothetical protein
MEPAGDKFRSIKFKRALQVVQLVVVVENKRGEEEELILDTQRRPVPVPYTEEP